MLASALCALAILLSAPARAASVEISVVYQKRDCEQSTALTPGLVTAGTLVVHFPNEPAVSVSLGEAPVKVALKGTGELAGTLILETPRVEVITAGLAKSLPQQIALGSTPVLAGKASFALKAERAEAGVYKIIHDEGHVNALVKLDKAARVAAQASPVPLPKLTALVYDCDAMPEAVCPATAFDAPSTIHVGRGAGANSQWEANTLAHEYGHFVMHTVAPGGNSGGDHDIQVSNPDKPDLAWTEGFAIAFSGVVNNEGKGILQTACVPNINLANKPANPHLLTEKDQWFAQYNELRVGAVAYQLINYLGGDMRGLKQLLTAMAGYQRDGHPPWVARDLRDLAVGFERTAADHADIDRFFMYQGIYWDQGFSVSMKPYSVLGTANQTEIVLSIKGPEGFDCHVKAATQMPLAYLDDGRAIVGIDAAEGGLKDSVNDDCYLVSGDGQVPKSGATHDLGIDHAEIPFPYLPNQAHWHGPFTVTARLVCRYDPGLGPREVFKCPESVDFATMLTHPPYYDGASPKAYEYPITLRNNQDVAIAIFTADGKCHAGTPPQDCSF